MSKPKPLTEWQSTLPPGLPRHIKRNIVLAESGCWLWTRSRSPDGYGWASHNNRTCQAHRLVFRLIQGEPDSGLVLDHLCRVRHCVNPMHMEPVTPAENIRRSELTPAGVRVCARCGSDFSTVGTAKPQRRCVPCATAYNEARKPAKREQERERRRRKAA